MSKKLIFLTARLPYPANSGRKNVMYYYCKYLHEMYGYEIINISFLEDGDTYDGKPDFISKVYTLNNIKIGKKIRNIVSNTFVKKEWPLQVSLYYDKEIQKKIDEIIKIEKPEIIMCDMIRTSEYMKNYDIPKILDMDDMLSIRYERQLELDLSDINPYGAILFRFPKTLQKILSIKFIKKYMLELETNLIKKYEMDISKKYNAVVFVSEKEADRMNKRLNCKKCFSVPLGVDIEYFMNEEYKDTIKEEKSISFLGAMNVAHNETAVIHFCENILPKVKESINDIKFYIVGGGVTDKLRSKCKNQDGIIITNRVDDVRKYIFKTNVFVSPLLFGSGIKTKNIEAMSMSVPVVTTEIGAESIDAESGVHWFIENDDSSFANRIIELIEDKELNNTISKNGLEYVKDNFTWDKNMTRWSLVFDYIKQSIN